MTKTLVLKDELDKYFSLFNPSIELITRLTKAKENAQEVLLLLCARLDALASSSANEEQTNRSTFDSLVTVHGGERILMERVSAGDLYRELAYHHWMVQGLIPKPGRLVRYSRLNDPIINLLADSEIPLTEQAGRALLARLMKVVESLGRCRPKAQLKKPTMIEIRALTAAIRNEFQHSRTVNGEKVAKAIQPLLQAKTGAGILYQNFRNEAVHGIEVKLDEDRFFTAAQPYWRPWYPEYYPSFLALTFPAPFLLSLLQNCINNLRKAWTARGKVPPDVHFHIFGFALSRLDLCDVDLFPQGRALGVQRVGR